jgi:hypothetical protein
MPCPYGRPAGQQLHKTPRLRSRARILPRYSIPKWRDSEVTRQAVDFSRQLRNIFVRIEPTIHFVFQNAE